MYVDWYVEIFQCIGDLKYKIKGLILENEFNVFLRHFYVSPDISQ